MIQILPLEFVVSGNDHARLIISIVVLFYPRDGQWMILKIYMIHVRTEFA